MIRFLLGCVVVAAITSFLLDRQPAPQLLGSNPPVDLRDAFGNGATSASVAVTFFHDLTTFVLKGISDNE